MIASTASPPWPQPCLHVQTPFPPFHIMASVKLPTPGRNLFLLSALSACPTSSYCGKALGPRVFPIFEDQAWRLFPQHTEQPLRGYWMAI